MQVKDFLKPNLIKIYLTLVFLIPLLVLSILLTEYMYEWSLVITFFILAVMLAAAYFMACIYNLIYSKTQNIWIKLLLIAIATVLSMGAALLIFLVLYRPIIICDPVHRPPVICDPVHTPSEAGIAPIGVYGTIPEVTGTIKKQYEQLRQKFVK